MKLWEKNFEINKEIERFTVGRDREMDLYLAKYDVLGSMAHITMLESIGLLEKDELTQLLAELKNIYHLAREALNLTRAAASEKMGFISESRIEKIEYEKTLPQPEDVLAMSKAYKNPGLCNYYCSRECPIGQEYIPEVKEKSLSQIVLELLSSLNTLSKQLDQSEMSEEAVYQS